MRTDRVVRLNHFIRQRGIDSVAFGEAATQRVIGLNATWNCRSLHTLFYTTLLQPQIERER